MDKIIKQQDPEDVRLSQLLYDLIKEQNPSWYVNPKIEKWADHIRLLREQDHRTPEQIEFMIRWVQRDPFWRMNILSTEKLRKQFNNLVVRVGQGMRQKGKTIIE